MHTERSHNKHLAASISQQTSRNKHLATNISQQTSLSKQKNIDAIGNLVAKKPNSSITVLTPNFNSLPGILTTMEIYVRW